MSRRPLTISTLLAIATALCASPAAAQESSPASCPPGQSVNPDSAGHCCWPAQAWSVSRAVCVGTPTCPAGFAAQGESCAAVVVTPAPMPVASPAPMVCPPGQSVTADSAGHCCWSNQVWSVTRETCVGTPQCPPGLTAQGETCAAPACPAGQSIGADTAGHCCWGGQVWSASRQTCVGVPQCPAGLAAQGETCVTAASEPATEVRYGRFGIPHRVSRVPRDASQGVPPGMHVEQRMRTGVLVGGAVLFVAGYVVSAIIAGIATAAGDNEALTHAGINCNRSMSSGYIPIVGPILAYTNYPTTLMTSTVYSGGYRETYHDDCGAYVGLVATYAAVDTVLQVGGLAMVALGAVLRRDRLVPDHGRAVVDRSPQWSVLPTAPGAPLGVSLVMTHF